MIRYVLSAAFALMICTVTILAAEVKGVLKSVDTDKGTITVTVKADDKESDKTYKVVEKDLKITGGKDGTTDMSADGLKGKAFGKGGAKVTLTTDGDKGDEKEMVKSIVIMRGKKGT